MNTRRDHLVAEIALRGYHGEIVNVGDIIVHDVGIEGQPQSFLRCEDEVTAEDIAAASKLI